MHKRRRIFQETRRQERPRGVQSSYKLVKLFHNVLPFLHFMQRPAHPSLCRRDDSFLFSDLCALLQHFLHIERCTTFCCVSCIAKLLNFSSSFTGRTILSCWTVYRALTLWQSYFSFIVIVVQSLRVKLKYTVTSIEEKLKKVPALKCCDGYRAPKRTKMKIVTLFCFAFNLWQCV